MFKTTLTTNFNKPHFESTFSAVFTVLPVEFEALEGFILNLHFFFWITHNHNNGSFSLKGLSEAACISRSLALTHSYFEMEYSLSHVNEYG